MFGCGEKRHALGTASRYPKYLGVRGDAPHSAMGSKAIVVSLLTLQLSTATSQIMLCYPLSEPLLCHTAECQKAHICRASPLGAGAGLRDGVRSGVGMSGNLKVGICLGVPGSRLQPTGEGG